MHYLFIAHLKALHQAIRAGHKLMTLILRAVWPHAPTQKIIVTSFLSKVSEREIKKTWREVRENELRGSRGEMADS